MSFVESEMNEGVLTLRLNRPEKLNALSRPMRIELIDKLKSANSDSDVRCVIITGNGKGFCVGADLDSIAGDLGDDLSETFHPILREIRFGPKLFISAVNGVAAGAGISIALAADVRYCNPSARFVTAFHSIGLAPDTGLSFLLPRLAPSGRLIQLLLTGGELGAVEASEGGLFNIAEDPVSAAGLLAARLSGGPLLSYTESKKLLNESVFGGMDSFLVSEASAQGRLGRTKDFEEGKKAFSEKRKPSFRGE